MSRPATEAGAVRVGSLDEVRKRGCVVVSMDRPVAVFYHNEMVFAVDNRCPHMGFPLQRGTVKDGILTCYWHHARFDLASGSTFDLFADDVATYPVEVRDEEVWVLPRPPANEVARWKRRLEEGMEQDISLVTAKSVIGLVHQRIEPRDIVRQVAVFGTRYRDGWADGLTILTAMANLLPYIPNDERMLPLWHGAVRVARNVAGESPRWDRQPLARDDLPVGTLTRWLRHWVLVRHRDGAERCLQTAIANDLPPAEVAEALFAAATDRVFADGGHVVDFTNKAFELLDLIGWNHAGQVLPSLVRQLVSARGGEESSEWRQPEDLIALLQSDLQNLPDLIEVGRKRNPKAVDLGSMVNVLLGDSPGAIVKGLKESLGQGVPPVELSKLIAYAAAMRIARFGTANEFTDWVTVLHTFSYCNALHQTVKRLSATDKHRPSSEVVRGIFHGALSVHLDRFLNIPPSPLPGERESLDDEPKDGQQLRANFLSALDRQAKVDEAGRIVARYMSLGHPVEPLIQTLVHAVVREDAEFHTYQMLEAAIRQFEEWRGTEQANHVLVAAARYIAAHSPTQREMLQTADIALRLHRGEALYENA